MKHSKHWFLLALLMAVLVACPGQPSSNTATFDNSTFDNSTFGP